MNGVQKARELQKKIKADLPILRSNLDSLRSKINRSTRISATQKESYLRFINERAQSLAKLSTQPKNANSYVAFQELQSQFQLIRKINEDLQKINTSFDKMHQRAHSAAQAPKLTSTVSQPTIKTQSSPRANPQLEKSKYSLVDEFVATSSQLSRIKQSMSTISTSVLPSSMYGLTTEQTVQRVSTVTQMNNQYEAMMSQMNTLGKTIGAMPPNITAEQITKMRASIKDISAQINMLGTRIAKETVKSFPEVPKGPKSDPSTDSRPRGRY